MLEKALAEHSSVDRRQQSYGVGAKAGDKLRDDAAKSIVYAIFLIMLYLAFRFDIRYAPGAAFATIHDAVMVIGVFAVTWTDVSLTSVAGLLTVMGYSVNDTVIVFDRIRENQAKLKDKKIERIIDISINEMLVRTILTSSTVFATTLIMNIFGTGVVKNFAFAMNIGVIVGTYSSIFLAAPIFMYISRSWYSGPAPKRRVAPVPSAAPRPARSSSATTMHESRSRDLASPGSRSRSLSEAARSVRACNARCERSTTVRRSGSRATLRVRPATARCLVARGVTEPREAQGFIDPRLAALRPAGRARPGWRAAVERIADAVVRGERIGVFGDYDVDGVTTAALLDVVPARVAARQVECAVARRDAGYGFTPGRGGGLRGARLRLVVTGDCGTSDLDAIARGRGARRRGDRRRSPHGAGRGHARTRRSRSSTRSAPDSTFPFRGMASVGLAFYVAASVRTELRDRGWFRDAARAGRPRPARPRRARHDRGSGAADRGEPDPDVARPAPAADAARGPGIAALLAAAGVDPEREVDARTVAWKLAPRLNAPGRLGAAEPVAVAAARGRTATRPRARSALEAARTPSGARSRIASSTRRSRGSRRRRDPGPAIVIAGEGWPTRRGRHRRGEARRQVPAARRS